MYDRFCHENCEFENQKFTSKLFTTFLQVLKKENNSCWKKLRIESSRYRQNIFLEHCVVYKSPTNYLAMKVRTLSVNTYK